MYLINKQTRLVLEWGFCAVTENNIWQVGVGELTHISCNPEPWFFRRYLVFFFIPAVLLRCTRGTFCKLIPCDWKWCFLTELTVSMQKMEGISLPCQRGKPDELRSVSLIHIYCLTAYTGQHAKKLRGSSWNDASSLGFWYTFAAGAQGPFASLCSGAVSR